MFHFKFTGKVVAVTLTDDQRQVRLKVAGDAVTGCRVMQGDDVLPIAVYVPVADMPAGVALGHQVAISGVGYIGGVTWFNKVKDREQVIENTRLNADSVEILPTK